MVEPINALGLLKEEMQTEEIHLKVNAIHRLKIVILSIGPEQVGSQLIPYLQSKLNLYPVNKSDLLTKVSFPFFLSFDRRAG
jgi:hypothetical protein